MKNFVLSLSALLLSILIVFFTSWISKTPTADHDVFFVKKGQSLYQVVQNLKKENRISSTSFLYYTLRFLGAHSNLKSGQYRLNGSESIADYYKLFTEGRYESRGITIPEGYSNKRLAGILKKYGMDSLTFMSVQSDAELLKKYGIPAKSTEGYLLPNTYQVNYDITEYDFTVLLLDSQKLIWTDQMDSEIKNRNLTRHKILTMASIIEGEAMVESEMTRISGVYWNRIAKGIALGADPTIQYIIPNGPRRVFFKDLEIQSPYNTYRVKGLPPGPIGNPGEKSIMAAIYPEKHNYLYFVADGFGGHVFTKSLIEHNKAKAKYDSIMKPRRAMERQKTASASEKNGKLQ